MTSHGKRGDVLRIHCSRAIEAGTCDHRRKYNLLSVEEETLRGLRQELRDPQLIGEFVRAYHAERRRLAANSANDRARIQRELSKTKGRLARLVDALADGLLEADAVKDKLTALEAERRRLEAEAAMAAASIDPIAIHPAAVTRYLEVVEQLASSLRSANGASIGKDGDHLRTLIERVIVHPVPTRAPLDIEIRGYLAQLLNAPQIPPNGRYRASGGNDGARRYGTAVPTRWRPNFEPALARGGIGGWSIQDRQPTQLACLCPSASGCFNKAYKMSGIPSPAGNNQNAT